MGLSSVKFFFLSNVFIGYTGSTTILPGLPCNTACKSPLNQVKHLFFGRDGEILCDLKVSSDTESITALISNFSGSLSYVSNLPLACTRLISTPCSRFCYTLASWGLMHCQVPFSKFGGWAGQEVLSFTLENRQVSLYFTQACSSPWSLVLLTDLPCKLRSLPIFVYNMACIFLPDHR